MKVKIFPRIRYLDSDSLRNAFIPRTLSDKTIKSLQVLITRYQNNNGINWVDEFLQTLYKKNLLYSRNEWCEIRLGSLKEYFDYWWKGLRIEICEGYLLTDIDKEFITRYLEGHIDYYIDEKIKDYYL